MKNISKIIIICSLFSQNLFAYELQTKKRNTDKSEYIINPTAKIQKQKYQVNLNSSYTQDPLILMNNNQSSVLIKSIMTHEFSFSYKILDNLQLGIGSQFHQFESIKKESYLDSFLVDAKLNLFKNFALNPYFIMGKEYGSSIDLKGKAIAMPVGNAGGAYGVKLIYDLPFKTNSFSFFMDYQKNMKPEKFLNMINTYKYSVGISSTIDLAKDIKWKNEFYADYTDTANPLALLTYLRFQDTSYALDLGIGTSDLFLAGANKYRAFAGLAFFFGGKETPFYKKPEVESYEHSQGKQLHDGEMEEQKYEDIPVLEEPQSFLNNKNSRSIASVKIKNEMKILPNGKKVKVFYAEHVNQMPTEIGVSYVTIKEYENLKKKISSDMKVAKENAKKQAIVDQMNASLISEPAKNEVVVENKVAEVSIPEKMADSVNVLMPVEDKDPENILVNVIDGVILEANPVVKSEVLPTVNVPEVIEVKNYVEIDHKTRLEDEKKLFDSLVMKKLKNREDQEKDIKQKEIIKDIIIVEEKSRREEVLKEKEISPEELKQNRKDQIYKEFNSKKVDIHKRNNGKNATIVQIPVIKEDSKKKEAEIASKIDKENILKSEKGEIIKSVINGNDNSINEMVESEDFPTGNTLQESNDIEEINEPLF